jgi:hypothetical protein
MLSPAETRLFDFLRAGHAGQGGFARRPPQTARVPIRFVAGRNRVDATVAWTMIPWQ